MRCQITFFAVLLYLPLSGQPFDPQNRKSEIEEYMKPVHSISEFRRVVDSLQMSVSELSDYPVVFPVKKPLRISSGFGKRNHPVFRWRKFHTGIDIPQTNGTPVYATGNGVVIRRGYDPGYGNFVEIEHAGNFRSFYAHLSTMMVNIGDSVRITQQVACIGNTGISTGCHLHYEIRKGKRFLNPAGWCGSLFEILKSKDKQNY